MDRWETQEDFLKWMAREKNKHKTFYESICRNFDAYPRYYWKDITSELNTSQFCASINLHKIKLVLNNDILAHLNSYFSSKNIHIHHIYVFLETVEAINFFKKSKLSSDYSEYKREIKQLKKTVDNIQQFSKNPIEVRIPILPHICIYGMKEHYKRYALSKETINIFVSYFGLGKRYRKTEAYKKELKLMRENFSFILLEYLNSRKSEVINENYINPFFDIEMQKKRIENKNSNIHNFVMSKQFYYISSNQCYFHKSYYKAQRILS